MIILAFVVLLSGLVVAFFSRAMSERQVSNSSANQTKADIFAQGAADQIIGDLKQEIVNGSTATAAGSGTIYVPKAAADMVPALAGSTGSGGLENLVKRSARGLAFSPKGPATRASTASSTGTSLNNRSISPSRWNRPLFLPTNTTDLTAANTTNYTPVLPSATFTAPDWILVARGGSNPPGFDPNVIWSGANDTTVVGRYAYNIYDEGGLLDMNVAGYPRTDNQAYSSTNSDPRAAYKGALAFADLTQLPGFGVTSPNGGAPLTASPRWQVINALVGWRNYASLSLDPNQSLARKAPYQFTFPGDLVLAKSYTDLVLSNATGFLKPIPFPVSRAQQSSLGPGSQTDQMFVGRQQLIRFFTQATTYRLNNTASTTDNIRIRAAFPYLTHFSRELNAPSWSPTKNATDMGAADNGVGNVYAYKNFASTNGVTNRLIPDVRVSGAFTRPDGTTAKVGDPLMNTRFPLSRIGGLGPTGVVTNVNSSTTMINGTLSPASAATVQRDFGLVWNTDHWDYCGPAGNTVQSSIAKIDSIGSREPNFFELLKAGILTGSLGKDAGTTGTWYVNYEEGPASGLDTDDKNADVQIIRIGANIIDQYDADSYPTEIRFADPVSKSVSGYYGIENLPYLQRVFAKTLQPDPVELAKNPKNTNYVGGWLVAEVWNPHQDAGYTAATTPAFFRFRGEGVVQMFHSTGPPVVDVTGQPQVLASSGSVDFTTASAKFRDPTCLSKDASLIRFADCTPTIPENDPFGTHLVVGLRAGSVASTDKYGGIQPLGCDLVLEYAKAAGGPYKVYDRMKNLRGAQHGNTLTEAYYYQRVDPRTDRFGTSVGKWTYATIASSPAYDNRPGGSLRKDNTNGLAGVDYFPRPASGFIYPNSAASGIFQNFFMGTLSDTVAGSNPYYKDPDGVLRSAEGNYYATGNDGRPLISGNVASRPVVLNRPFRNVGELGYAFRDLPWKNIDFFTANSGDAGLLDLFCASEQPSMVAGKLNINTRQAPVLQAIVAGAIKNNGAGAQTYVTGGTSSEASTIANTVLNLAASSKPLLNKSELVSAAATSLGSGYSTSTDKQIKSRREAAVRALAEVSNTRTWNLMIDLVAQIGRYPPSANNLDKFLVEGEKRYWVHVAIDRYTGEVVDKQVEVVNE